MSPANTLCKAVDKGIVFLQTRTHGNTVTDVKTPSDIILRNTFHHTGWGGGAYGNAHQSQWPLTSRAKIPTTKRYMVCCIFIRQGCVSQRWHPAANTSNHPCVATPNSTMITRIGRESGIGERIMSILKTKTASTKRDPRPVWPSACFATGRPET